MGASFFLISTIYITNNYQREVFMGISIIGRLERASKPLPVRWSPPPETALGLKKLGVNPNKLVYKGPGGKKAGELENLFKPPSNSTPRPVQLPNPSVEQERAVFVGRIADPVRATEAEPSSEGINRRIRTIYVAEDNAFYRDLKETGAVEGFDVVLQLQENPWIEDSQIMLEDGVILVPNQGDISNVIEKDNIEAYLPPDSYYWKSSHPERELIQGGTGKYRDQKKAIRYAKHGYVQARSYLEGGNVLSTTGPSRERRIIIGQDSVLFSYLMLEEQGEFEDAEVQAMIGRLNLTTEQIETAQTVLTQAGIITSSMTNDGKIAKATEYLAKHEITKQIIAKDLGVDPSQVTYVKQPGFHIDMYMRPGLDNTVFIQDYQETINLLDKLLRNPETKGGKRLILQKFRKHAIKMQREMGPTMADIKNSLHQSGYKVISVPGVFHGADKRVGDVNFMNGITGTGKDDGKFYITNGSNIPELNDAFARIMNFSGVDSIYFVGRSDDKRGYEPVHESLKEFGALDCRTIEVVDVSGPKKTVRTMYTKKEKEG